MQIHVNWRQFMRNWSQINSRNIHKLLGIRSSGSVRLALLCLSHRLNNGTHAPLSFALIIVNKKGNYHVQMAVPSVTLFSDKIEFCNIPKYIVLIHPRTFRTSSLFLHIMLHYLAIYFATACRSHQLKR